MNQLSARIKEAISKPVQSIRRFPFSFAMLCLITIDGIFLILTEGDSFELLSSLCSGALFCFLMELAYEYDIHKRKPLIPVTGAIMTFLFLMVQDNYDNIYIYTALIGLDIAVICLIAYILFRDRENRCLFSHLVKSAFIVSIFCSVILSSISVCIAAFHILIYSFSELWKIYLIFFLTVTVLFGITLFLSYIPKKDEEISVPALYRTIIHKTLFYIYLILIGILYLYIIKIIVTWKMPVGRLNWFGCFSLLFYVFFYLSIDETDGRYQTLFKRYGAYLLIPVLAIQLFAIAIRLHAYGLTTARLMSLIMIAIAVGFMISQILHIHVAKCFLYVCLLCILFTCTPFNIYDIPNRSQERRLQNALTRGGALVDGVLYDDVVMEAEYLEDVKSAYDYLRYSSGNKSAFFKEFKNSKIANSLYEYDNYHDNIRSIYYSTSLEGQEIDVSSFITMQMVSGDTIEDEELKSFFISLDETKTEEYKIEGLIYETTSGDTIIFTYINFDYDEIGDEFLHLYWDGILLSR